MKLVALCVGALVCYSNLFKSQSKTKRESSFFIFNHSSIVDRGDIEPHLICTVGAADRSVCVLALSTKGDAWLWSMLSPSRHTRPQFGVLDLGMKGAEVNDVIALSSHLSQRGKLDVLVASGGDIFLVSVVEGTSG